MFPSSSPRIKHPENHDAEVDLFFLTAHMSLNDIYIVFLEGERSYPAVVVEHCPRQSHEMQLKNSRSVGDCILIPDHLSKGNGQKGSSRGDRKSVV